MPWAAGLRGDWQAAANAWAAAGDPYEQALELAESERQQELLEALTILDRLGATAAAQLVRQRLKAIGARAVPRGPTSRTRANPAGLTSRQLDVLALVSIDRTGGYRTWDRDGRESRRALRSHAVPLTGPGRSGRHRLADLRVRMRRRERLA